MSIFNPSSNDAIRWRPSQVGWRPLLLVTLLVARALLHLPFQAIFGKVRVGFWLSDLDAPALDEILAPLLEDLSDLAYQGNGQRAQPRVGKQIHTFVCISTYQHFLILPMRPVVLLASAHLVVQLLQWLALQRRPRGDLSGSR